jgi:hypothetical protein
MTSLEGGPSILSCRRKTDIAISVGAGRCALDEIINYKLRTLREHIQDHNSEHGDQALGAMANLLKQELPLRKQRRAALL